MNGRRAKEQRTRIRAWLHRGVQRADIIHKQTDIPIRKIRREIKRVHQEETPVTT